MHLHEQIYAWFWLVRLEACKLNFCLNKQIWTSAYEQTKWKWKINYFLKSVSTQSFNLNKSFLLCFMKNVIRNCKGGVMASVSYFKQNNMKIMSKFAWNFLVIWNRYLWYLFQRYFDWFLFGSGLLAAQYQLAWWLLILWRLTCEPCVWWLMELFLQYLGNSSAGRKRRRTVQLLLLAGCLRQSAPAPQLQVLSNDGDKSAGGKSWEIRENKS